MMYRALIGLVWALRVWGDIQVAILMQGSDFINVSVVPLFNVNQFDLGDVFISPCRAGTYNDVRDGQCRPCAVCSLGQFERASCISVRNSDCVNCTVCTPREQQICACNERSAQCVTGDRICAPLPMTTVNVSFDLAVSQALSPLKERFLQEGLRTGFILFLAGYLQHSEDSITFLFMHKTGSTQYYTTFLVSDIYSLFTKRQVEIITQSVVQEGLTNTFGVQSNTFSTVSQQRRRLRRLLEQNAITLIADKVESQIVSVAACSRFFVMSSPDNPFESMCVSIPCPPGYTGFYGMCELCPNATFKGVDGNESCTQCPTGWQSDQGAVSLGECRAPPTSPPPMTTSVSQTHPQYATTTLTTAVTKTMSGTRHAGATAPTTTAALSVVPVTQRNTAISSKASSFVYLTTVAPPPDPQPTGSVSSTQPYVPGSGGVGVINNNYQVFNISFVQNLFFSEWNSGRAGTVQYITINEERDDWAMTAAGVVMSAGFFAIAAIGARLFWVIQRPSARKASAVAVVEQEDGKTVIPIPVKRSQPPTRREPSPPSRPLPPDIPVHLGGAVPAVYRRHGLVSYPG